MILRLMKSINLEVILFICFYL